MKILFVCATPLECSDLLQNLGLSRPPYPGASITSDGRFGVLCTGIGMVNTAIQLSQAILQYKPEKVVNFGIAGGFVGKVEMLEVVQVVKDTYSELGAESAEGFLGLEQMGFALMEKNGMYWYNTLENPSPDPSRLRNVHGITVNTVHGLQEGIDDVTARWNPDIESMEGAAVFHTCLAFGVPFDCYRAISNVVEIRNRANWRVREAVLAVQEYVFEAYLAGRL